MWTTVVRCWPTEIAMTSSARYHFASFGMNAIEAGLLDLGRAASPVECSKRIGRVVAPMRLEAESPFPDRGGAVALLPKREASPDVGKDLLGVVWERPSYEFVLCVWV